MTKSATRRAVLAGWLERVFSQDVQTKCKRRASTEFGARAIYRKLGVCLFLRGGDRTSPRG